MAGIPSGASGPSGSLNISYTGHFLDGENGHNNEKYRKVPMNEDRSHAGLDNVVQVLLDLKEGLLMPHTIYPLPLEGSTQKSPQTPGKTLPGQLPVTSPTGKVPGGIQPRAIQTGGVVFGKLPKPKAPPQPIVVPSVMQQIITHLTKIEENTTASLNIDTNVSTLNENVAALLSAFQAANPTPNANTEDPSQEGGRRRRRRRRQTKIKHSKKGRGKTRR